MRWIVTGGLGFIGSHFIRLALRERPALRILNLDAQTYAGNPENLRDLEGDPRYAFLRGDIADAGTIDEAASNGADAIVNFAAETHVDRSIAAPGDFVRTNVLGTHALLEAARRHRTPRFLQVSTDEVYGDVAEGAATEDWPLRPRSPYAASKAASDLLALAAHATYGLPVLITRGSNTYGPNQYPEKLIPLFITNLLEGRPIPIYGDGRQIRDWLHVEDHARGILSVLERGTVGETYNLGAGATHENLTVAKSLLEACGAPLTRLQHVADRPGHDRRYALNFEKARALGWQPRVPFQDGLLATVDWYRKNTSWWREILDRAGATIGGPLQRMGGAEPMAERLSR